MLNFLASLRREREAVRELSRLTDRELADIGLCRSDIRDVAASAREAEAPRREPRGRMAPAWGTHVRGSVAA